MNVLWILLIFLLAIIILYTVLAFIFFKRNCTIKRDEVFNKIVLSILKNDNKKPLNVDKINHVNIKELIKNDKSEENNIIEEEIHGNRVV